MGLTSISYLDDPLVEDNGEILGRESDLRIDILEKDFLADAAFVSEVMREER